MIRSDRLDPAESGPPSSIGLLDVFPDDIPPGEVDRLLVRPRRVRESSVRPFPAGPVSALAAVRYLLRPRSSSGLSVPGEKAERTLSLSILFSP